MKHSSLFCRSITDEENCTIALTPGINVIKLFFFITDGGAKLSQVLVPEKFFQNNCILRGRILVEHLEMGSVFPLYLNH